MRRIFGGLLVFFLCGQAAAEERRDLSDVSGGTRAIAGASHGGLLFFPPMPDLPNPFSPGFGHDPRGLDISPGYYRAERLPELGVDVSLGARAAAMGGVDRLTLMLRAGGDLEAGEHLSRWRASAGAAATDGPLSVSAGFALASERENVPVQLYGGLSVQLNF